MRLSDVFLPSLISIIADKGAVRFISFHIDENSEISVGGLRFEGCIKDVRLNGQTLANRIAIEIMSQGR